MTKCIAALAACLKLEPEEDVDFPCPHVPANKLDRLTGAVTDPPVAKDYLTWTTDCCTGCHALLA